MTGREAKCEKVTESGAALTSLSKVKLALTNEAPDFLFIN
jgi:hypothetical protein